MESKLPFLVGYASLQSNLSLEQIGEILSQKMFGGARFEGKELEIHEEVPAIFIQSPLMGLKIILDGCRGFDEGCGFNLSVHPWTTFDASDNESISLDYYLSELLKVSLKDIEDIVVLPYSS